MKAGSMGELVAILALLSIGTVIVVFGIVHLAVVTTTPYQLRAEAVERGYAEWYAEEPGEQPTQWRWNEQE